MKELNLRDFESDLQRLIILYEDQTVYENKVRELISISYSHIKADCYDRAGVAEK